jgi:hypothetical protein
MHCNVCHSAKKPLSIVTSHYPKNREGNTVCPTLLSQECRLCGKKGHTVKYCTKEQTRDNKEQSRINKEQSRINKEQQAPIKKRVLEVFNVLYESSDDEETRQEPNQEKQEKQEKKKVKKVKDPNAKFCWATAESDSSGESESDSD